MKPRNDDEREVLRLSALLPALTEKQLEWAFKQTTKKGDTYYRDKHHRDLYLTFATTFRGWQIFRLYYCNTKEYVRGSKYNKKGSFYVWGFECIQKWIPKEDPATCITMGMPLKNVPNGHYQRTPFASGEMPMWWSLKEWKPLEMQIRCSDIYDKWFVHLYPRSTFLKGLEWWGKVMRKDYRLSVDHLSESYGTYSETLLKMGRIDIYEQLLKHDRSFIPCIKVALRNGGLKESSDVQTWFDHVQLLRRLGMDDRSPKYLCPNNLFEEHERLNEREQRIEVQRQIERALERARKNNKISEGIKLREKIWGDYSIQENGLTFVPLITIDDYVVEGKRMHHCVGGYYDHFSSLILSARGEEGKRRWETIEINLNSFRIIQSQGLQNHDTSRHKEIMGIVMRHMDEIRDIQSKAKKKAVVASA